MTFAPGAVGSLTGALTVNNNASGTPAKVGLTGTGIGPVAAVSPSSLTFGNENVGVITASKPVTLSNTGNAPLTIASIATTTANFPQTNNCGSSVAIHGSCTINVAFKPVATGPLSGTLTITDNSNEVSNNMQRVSLTGTGLPPVVVTLSPPSASLALGGTQVFTATISNPPTPP